jgi:hypothetical protein
MLNIRKVREIMSPLIYSQKSYKIVGACFSVYYAQVMNYLSATSIKLGLLVNFGHYPKLEYKRIIFTEKAK